MLVPLWSLRPCFCFLPSLLLLPPSLPLVCGLCAIFARLPASLLLWFSLVVVVPFSTCPLVSGSFFVVALLCSNVWIDLLGQPWSAGPSGRACPSGLVGPVGLVGCTFSFCFSFCVSGSPPLWLAPPPSEPRRRGLRNLLCFGSSVALSCLGA